MDTSAPSAATSSCTTASSISTTAGDENATSGKPTKNTNTQLRDIELTRQRQNAIDYTKLRADNLDGKSRVAARRDAFGPVVYYIQFRDAIKIGTAIDPANRLSALPWEWVLAMEPGGRELEQGRHQQFEKTRFLGEWFYDSAELREHIDYINDMHSKWRDQRFPQCPDFPWRHDEVVIPPIVAELSG